MNKETRNNEISNGADPGFSNDINCGISIGSKGAGTSTGPEGRGISAGPDKRGSKRKEKNALLIAGGILFGTAVLAGAGVGISKIVENRGNYSDLGKTGGITEVKAGQGFKVPADSIINGDVMIEVNGKLQRLFDNNPDTGAQVITEVPLKGYAPIFEGNKGGATIETNIDPALIDTIAEQDRVVTAEVTGIKAENIEVVKFPQGK